MAILAVLKAGGVYVPLDPEDPRERLDFFVADSRPAVVLTKRTLADRFSAPESAGCAFGRRRRRDRAAKARTIRLAGPRPDNAVCLLYTSGSTGQPKGAVNLHRGICNYLLCQAAVPGLGPDDRVLFDHAASVSTSRWRSSSSG